MATGESKTKWDGFIHADDVTDKNEQPFEISLCYPAKQDESEILLTLPADVKQIGIGRDWTENTKNAIYYGDNLPVLAHLLRDKEICGQVNLIYIDPPFATNRVYKSRSQKDAYSDTLTGWQYVEFLRKRLILLRELMSPSGSIYIHLDQNMVFHIKLIMDELFGRSNFRSLITRRKCNPKNYTRNSYGNISDFLLFYTKSDQYIWNRPYDKWTNEKEVKEYSYIEPETGRRYKKVPIHAPGTRNGETGQPWRGILPPPGKHWQYSPSTLDEMDSRGEIYWSPNGNPRRKVYLDTSQGIPVQDIWLDVKDAHNQNIKITGYPTEKPPALLDRIIRASSNPGDLVLDCFLGSGTTLEVASDLKRQWIGIDKSKESIHTTLNRLRNGREKMGDYVVSKNTRNEKSPTQLSIWDQRSYDFVLYAQEPYKDELTDLIKEMLYL